MRGTCSIDPREKASAAAALAHTATGEVQSVGRCRCQPLQHIALLSNEVFSIVTLIHTYIYKYVRIRARCNRYTRNLLSLSLSFFQFLFPDLVVRPADLNS